MIRVLFFGTPHFSVPTLETLIKSEQVSVGAVITQPDRPAGRGASITQSPIKEVALAHGISVFQPTSIRKEFNALKNELDALGPFDLGIVIAFGQILPTEVLNYPRHGCVNIHASSLPRWRGAAPIHRAIEAGDQSTGVCLMQMDVGLDTGPVYSRQEIAISDDETCGSLHDKLATLGAELLARDILAITSGALTAVPQPNDGVTYASKVSNAEAAINWGLPAIEIERKVRAFNPYPGAHSLWNGRRLKIFKAKALNHSSSSEAPGTILSAQSEQLEVKCGSGILRIEELQLEGKRRMSSAEFMRGNTVVSGVALGQN